MSKVGFDSATLVTEILFTATLGFSKMMYKIKDDLHTF